MRFGEIVWKCLNRSAKGIGSLRRIRKCDHSQSERWAMYLPEKPKAPVTAIRTPAFHQAESRSIVALVTVGTPKRSGHWHRYAPCPRRRDDRMTRAPRDGYRLRHNGKPANG